MWGEKQIALDRLYEQFNKIWFFSWRIDKKIPQSICLCDLNCEQEESTSFSFHWSNYDTPIDGKLMRFTWTFFFIYYYHLPRWWFCFSSKAKSLSSHILELLVIFMISLVVPDQVQLIRMPIFSWHSNYRWLRGDLQQFAILLPIFIQPYWMIKRDRCRAKKKVYSAIYPETIVCDLSQCFILCYLRELFT